MSEHVKNFEASITEIQQNMQNIEGQIETLSNNYTRMNIIIEGQGKTVDVKIDDLKELFHSKIDDANKLMESNIKGWGEKLESDIKGWGAKLELKIDGLGEKKKEKILLRIAIWGGVVAGLIVAVIVGISHQISINQLKSKLLNYGLSSPSAEINQPTSAQAPAPKESVQFVTHDESPAVIVKPARN